jgi:thioesterase domain-containing protein
MTTIEVEVYLHEHIPLSAAMCVQVLTVNETGVRLFAPLEPNINHRQTVFGGSLSAVAILAAWACVHTRLQLVGHDVRLVIQRNNIEYLLPANGGFTASCPAPDSATWAQFIKTLERRGRARLILTTSVYCEETCVATLTGEFVAIRVN